jgi:hypothetical protein
MSVTVVDLEKGQCLRLFVAVLVTKLLCKLVWQSAEDLKQVHGL